MKPRTKSLLTAGPFAIIGIGLVMLAGLGIPYLGLLLLVSFVMQPPPAQGSSGGAWGLLAIASLLSQLAFVGFVLIAYANKRVSPLARVANGGIIGLAVVLIALTAGAIYVVPASWALLIWFGLLFPAMMVAFAFIEKPSPADRAVVSEFAAAESLAYPAVTAAGAGEAGRETSVPASLTTPGEQYTIRRKFFKIFGASFHIYDEQGALAGFCKQKAFKLREDIRIFTDESMQTPLVSIMARNIIDFSVTLDITLPTGESLGSMRRKGMASTFLRDEWLIFDAAEVQIGTLRENGGFLAFLRHNVEMVSLLSPQSFSLLDQAGRPVAQIRQHFNLFVYRLGIATTPEADAAGFDDLFVLALGCVVASIEGREGGG